MKNIVQRMEEITTCPLLNGTYKLFYRDIEDIYCGFVEVENRKIIAVHDNIPFFEEVFGVEAARAKYQHIHDYQRAADRCETEFHKMIFWPSGSKNKDGLVIEA